MSELKFMVIITMDHNDGDYVESHSIMTSEEIDAWVDKYAPIFDHLYEVDRRHNWNMDGGKEIPGVSKELIEEFQDDVLIVDRGGMYPHTISHAVVYAIRNPTFNLLTGKQEELQ